MKPPIPLFKIPNQISPQESELLRKREELMDRLLEVFTERVDDEDEFFNRWKLEVRRMWKREMWKVIISMNVQFGEKDEF